MGQKKELTLEDLQEQHREIAEVIGLENMVRLSEVFGGSSPYIPQPKELLRNYTYRAICEEYQEKGTDIKKLAAKYQVSVTTAYKIMKEIRKTPQKPSGKVKVEKNRRGTGKKGGAEERELPGQMTFADFGI